MNAKSMLEEHGNKALSALMVAMMLFVWDAKADLAVVETQLDGIMDVIEAKHPRGDLWQPSEIEVMHAGVFGKDEDQKARDRRLEQLKGGDPTPEPAPEPPGDDDDSGDDDSGGDDDSAGDDDDSAAAATSTPTPAPTPTGATPLPSP